jgi:hypothetical protein
LFGILSSAKKALTNRLRRARWFQAQSLDVAAKLPQRVSDDAALKSGIFSALDALSKLESA